MMKERVHFIDLMKALGILFVLVYHIYKNAFLKGWLNCFQLPIFLFAAGALFHDLPFRSFFPKRAKSLLLPYLVWGGVRSVIISWWNIVSGIWAFPCRIVF